MEKILILTDYNSDFLVALDDKDKYTSMDVNRIKIFFESKGYHVTIMKFSEIDLTESYKEYYVLYQTSETIGELYKGYIEDIVYFLEMNGARMIPKYKFLKAHHNKGFMELLRSTFEDEGLKSIKSNYYGSSIEAQSETSALDLPVVIKQNSGSGSTGVYCAKSQEEYARLTNKASNIVIAYDYHNLIKNTVKNKVKTVAYRLNENVCKLEKKPLRPIVVQNFIKNLSGDYKVLYFGGKYYTLYRENRDDDFRASGGGKLQTVQMEDNYPLLDYASRVVKEIEFPIIGMDIGFDGENYHLIEFQMIHLGPYTLQRAEHYFIRENDQWLCIKEKSDLEEEFTRSICEYIASI